MPMPANVIELMIKEAIPDADVHLIALVNDNDHFQAVVTSKQFIGKSRIQQHQMVYAALGPKMGNELHALSLKTEIPNK